MRNKNLIITSLLAILLLSSCYEYRLKRAEKKFIKQCEKEDKIFSSTLTASELPLYFKKEVSEDSIFLKTGWYYITDSINGILRVLDRADSISYYIDTVPILTVDNFTNVSMYETKMYERYIALAIFLDEQGTESFRIATEKSIHEKLAMIVNNVLIYTPIVNVEITHGVSVLNRSDYTPEDLLMFRNVLKGQMDFNQE